MAKLKFLMDRRILVLIALAAAAYAAAGRGNTLAYIGMVYYFLCAIAVFRNDPRAAYLLWAAVAVHLALVVYSVWKWQIMSVIPCHFCMAAAGFALLAATAWSSMRLAILPAILMVGVWFAWPLAFAIEPLPVLDQTGSQIQIQSAEKNPPDASLIGEDNPQTEIQVDPEKEEASPTVKTEAKTTTEADQTASPPEPHSE